MLITSLRLSKRAILKDRPTSPLSPTFYLYKKKKKKKKISTFTKRFSGLVSIKAYVIINYKLCGHGLFREGGNIRSILGFMLGSTLGFTLGFT